MTGMVNCDLVTECVGKFGYHMRCHGDIGIPVGGSGLSGSLGNACGNCPGHMSILGVSGRSVGGGSGEGQGGK